MKTGFSALFSICGAYCLYRIVLCSYLLLFVTIIFMWYVEIQPKHVLISWTFKYRLLNSGILGGRRSAIFVLCAVLCFVLAYLGKYLFYLLGYSLYSI